jgi:hypothetical protein
MILEDLKHIFKPQIDEGTTDLYYMVFDSPSHAQILRHPANDLSGMLPFVDCLQYAGTEARMPRFTK